MPATPISYLRSRNKVLAAKIEGTSGEAETIDLATDAISVNSVDVSPQPNIIESEELRGGLDPGDTHVVGSVPMQVTCAVPIKGSGSADTPPECAALLKISGLLENIQGSIATAVVSAAGTDPLTQFDMSAAAASWPATNHALLGRNVIITVKPTGPEVRQISKYEIDSVDPDLVHVTLSEPTSEAMDGTTSVAVEEGIIYIPHSGDMPTATIHVYVDGLLWELVGAAADMNLNMTSGARGVINFTISSVFASKDDVAFPDSASIGYDQTRPPVWRGGDDDWGRALINAQQAAIQQLTLALNTNVVQPDNPNRQDALDIALLTERNIQGTINPSESLIATRDIFTAFRDGTPHGIAAKYGSTSGNKIAMTIPEGAYRNETQANRNGYVVADCPFSTRGVNRGFALNYS